MQRRRRRAKVPAGKYGAWRLSGESMKSTLAILCGLLLSAALTNARAEDAEFSAQDKLMLTSLHEINMTTATVMAVFEYCMKQDPGFSLRALETLEAWKTRNMALVSLSPLLREESMVLAEREGMTRAEAGEVLDNAAKEVASTFPDMLDLDPDVSRRIHVCNVYVDKIGAGELDIAHGDEDQLRYLNSRLEALKR